MKILMLLSFFSLCKFGYGQCHGNSKFDPALFNSEFVKRYDTIYFSATFHDIGKVKQTSLLKILSEKNILNKRNYKTALSFTPLDSKIILYLPYKDIDSVVYEKLRSKQSTDSRICIRGILIKGYTKFNNEPFFLIDKVWFKE